MRETLRKIIHFRRKHLIFAVLLSCALVFTGCSPAFFTTGNSRSENLATVSDSDAGVSGRSDSGSAVIEPSIVEESTASDNGTSYPDAEPEAQNLTGFAYDQMDSDGQSLYAQLYSGITEEKISFSVYADNSDQISEAMNAVLIDHPEFFWIDGSATIRGIDGIPLKYLTLNFNINAGQIETVRSQIESAADAFISAIPEGAGEYDIVKLAYEYVITNTDYAIGSAQDQNIQSVFINHTSVCAGYAKALMYLLQRAGVYCAFIEGTIAPDNSAHAWNLVRIDGTYTLVDSTWGDPNYADAGSDPSKVDISYDYLCVTSEELGRTHTPSEKYTLPDCSSSQYDYYRLNGMFYETDDDDVLSRALWNSVDNNITTTFLKFPDKEIYESAYEKIFSQGLINEPLQTRMSWDEQTSIQYYYNGNENLYIIKIYW